MNHRYLMWSRCVHMCPGIACQTQGAEHTCRDPHVGMGKGFVAKRNEERMAKCPVMQDVNGFTE